MKKYVTIMILSISLIIIILFLIFFEVFSGENLIVILLFLLALNLYANLKYGLLKKNYKIKKVLHNKNNKRVVNTRKIKSKSYDELLNNIMKIFRFDKVIKVKKNNDFLKISFTKNMYTLFMISNELEVKDACIIISNKYEYNIKNLIDEHIIDEKHIFIMIFSPNLDLTKETIIPYIYDDKKVYMVRLNIDFIENQITYFTPKFKFNTKDKLLGCYGMIFAGKPIFYNLNINESDFISESQSINQILNSKKI